MTARAWLPAVVLAIGCGGSPTEPPPPPPNPVEVTVGGANADMSGFVTLDGDVLLVPGGQGGFHVWVKYRVTGAGAERINIAYTARRVSDGRLILTNKISADLGAPGSEGYWESPIPIPAFMCPSPLGITVQDQPMVFDFQVLDDADRVRGGATATFTPHCPEDDQAAHCVAICNG